MLVSAAVKSVGLILPLSFLQPSAGKEAQPNVSTKAQQPTHLLPPTLRALLQAVKGLTAFYNRATGVADGRIKQDIKNAMIMVEQARSMLAEGVIIEGLSNPGDRVSKDSVRSVIADMCGNTIPRRLVHPLLQELAASMVE